MIEAKIVSLIESFKISYNTQQSRRRNAEELIYPAINLADGEEDLFSILKTTKNRDILDMFLSIGSGLMGEDIKEIIAQNYNAPKDILENLSEESENVQMKLLSNPSVSKDIVTYLRRFGKAEVVKNTASRLLTLRKFKPQIENDQLLKGKISFHLEEDSHIIIPSEKERAGSLNIEPKRCSFINGSTYSTSLISVYNRYFLAKNEEAAYLARIDSFTYNITLLAEIEKVAMNEYKIVNIINQYFNVDEL